MEVKSFGDIDHYETPSIGIAGSSFNPYMPRDNKSNARRLSEFTVPKVVNYDKKLH
jgi:hypothetical protein